MRSRLNRNVLFCVVRVEELVNDRFRENLRKLIEEKLASAFHAASAC
jgi:hypothetical protein